MTDDKNKLPEEKKELSVNFASVLLDGLTLGDARLIGRNTGKEVVFNDDVESFKQTWIKAGGDPESPLIEKSFKAIASAWGAYKTNNYEPREVKGEYDFKGDDPSKPNKWFAAEGFGVTAMDATKSFDVRGKSQLIQHPAQNAEENRFYVSKDKKLFDLKGYDENKNNPLKQVFDQKTGTYTWFEAEDGEIVTADIIRHDDLVGGANTLKSGFWSSSARGIYQGAIVKTAQGFQGLLSIGYDLYRMAEDSKDGTLYSGMNDYYGKDDFGKMLGSMQNWINARSRVTTEESEGVFSNFNSFAYNFFDGVGQFLPMIATSYGLGATSALMQASKIPMLAGGIGQRTAVALTKVGGSLSVYGLIRNQMLEDGFTPEEAGLTALLFGSMTYVSESVFNADMAQKFGYRQAQNMIKGMEHKAVGAAMVENAGGVMTKEMVENLAKRSAGRNAGNLATKWKKFRSFIADIEAPGKGATIGARAAYAFRMAGEEATEELIEGVGQNKLIAPFMNDYARGTAKEITAKYEGLKFDAVTEGPNAGHYLMSTKFGEPQFISVAKRKAIDREVYFANKINSGEALLDEGINIDEAFIAGLSSLFTGGLMAGMGQQSIQKKNMNKWALAMSIIDNPSKRVQIEQEAYQIASEGLLGEKTQAKEYAEQFMQDIDLTVQFIRDKGLNSIDVVEAVNGDRSMMYELFEKVQNQIVLESAIEQLEKGASLKDIYASLGDNNKVIDPTIDDLKQLKLDLELTKAGIKALTTKRVDLVYEDTKGNKVTGKRSQAYADRFFNVESYEIMLEEKANQMAKDSFMFNKASYDKFLGDGTYARKLEERTQKNKEKLLADKSFNLEANFKLKILGSLSTQFDEFKEIVHRQGLEATLKSFQSYVASQQVDDIELKAFQLSINNFMDETYEIEESGTSRKTSIRETLKKLRSVKDESVSKIITSSEVKAVAERMKSLNQRTGSILNRMAYSEQGIYNSSQGIIETVQKTLESAIGEIGLDYQQVSGDPDLMSQLNPVELADITTGLSEIQESLSSEKLNIKQQNKIAVPVTIKEALSNEKFREYLDKRNSKNESPNRWVKILGPDMFKDFSSNVIALLNGLAFNGVANRSELTSDQIEQFRLFGKNQAFGNNILDAFENLMNLMNNKDAVIDNKHVVRETILKIDNALTNLYFYGKMNNEIIQEKYEKKDETKEMSRLLDREIDGNLQDNQSLRLSKKDFEDIKKFTEKAFEVVNAWSQDLRLGQAGREAYRMKIFAGNLALQYDMLKKAFEGGLFTGDLQKLVNQHLNEIDLIVESIQKRHAEAFKSNITMTLWDVSLLYSNIEDKEASNKIRLDVMRAFSKMADLKEVIGKDKEGVASLKKYAETILAAAYYPYGHLNTYMGVDVYGMDSANYESYFSPKTYEEGRALYEAKTTVKNSLPYDFFIRETVNFFYGIERQAGTSSDKKILEAYKARLEAQDKMDNVETYEQLMMLLHVIPFIQSGGESFAQVEPKKENSMKVKSNQVIPGFLSALGYAGAGKTELMVNLVTEIYSTLSGKPIKILIVTPTPHLREKHKEAIGQVRGNVTVEYMYQHEITNSNKKTRPNFAEYDIVFVEETGMLADNTDLNAYREVNKSTKEPTKGLAPIIGIGDLGQTPAFGATTTIKTPVGLNTEETKPLTEVHRSGVVSIIALQQFFRNMSFSKTSWKELPTAKWKRIGHKNVGLRYVKENSDKATRDLIKQNFLDAIDRFEKAENRAPNASEIILVVDTYKDKALLMEDEKFKNRSSNIFVLEYNSTEIAANKDYLNWNVSGIGANQVYIAITPNYEDPFMNSAPFVYALFGKLLTAASRGKEYVEIAIREGDVNTEQVEESEDISGYNENLDESKLREERERQNEIYREERVEELEVILGQEKQKQNVKEKDTTTVSKKEKDTTDNSDNKVFLLERNTPLYEGSVSFNAFDVVKNKKEKDYENTITHVSDKYNAESKVPLTRALYKLQSKAIRFALEGEEGVLYSKMENEFNEAFEELKSVYPKLAKFTPEELTAYKATVLRDAKIKAESIKNSAPGLIPNMAFTLGDYGGRVLGIEIVGFYEENNGGITRTVPIVNIHGLSLKSDMNVGFFDQKGITANRYGAYALMIESEGMKVNGIILHRIVPGGTSVLTSGIKSEFFNPVEIAKGIENAKNDIRNGQEVNPIVSIEELYSEPRIISAPEGMPETGINILYNGDRGIIEAYTATINDGEVVYTAMVRDSVTNEIKAVNANDLKSSLIKLKLTRSQKGETISEWREGNIYSNMAFVHPGAVTLLPSVGEPFWDWKNNKWMRIKDAIAKIAFEKKGSMTFLKEYHSSVEVIQIGKDGKVMATTESYDDVLLNVIQDTDILQIIKDADLTSMGINTVQKFKDAGLHILSFDSAPEVLLTLDQVKDPAIMKGDTFESIAIQDVLPEVYEKYMSGKINDNELSKALNDHYKGVMQEDAHADQLEMNVYRMRVLKNAKDSAKVTVGVVRLTTQNSLPFKRVTKDGGYEFSDFITNARLSGYTIELNQMITSIDPDTKRASIQVRVMKDGKTVGFIPLQAKKVTKENVILEKESLNNEIEGLSQNAEWITQINALNKAIDEKNENMAKEARTALYTMLDGLTSIAFINHNRRFFKEKSGSFHGVYFNGEDRLRYTHSDFGLKLRSLASALGEMISAAENNQYDLYYPIYKFAESGKKVLIVDNILTDTDTIFQRRNYFSKIKDEEINQDSSTKTSSAQSSVKQNTEQVKEKPKKYFRNIEKNGTMVSQNPSRNEGIKSLWRIEDNGDGTADIFFNDETTNHVKRAMGGFEAYFKESRIKIDYEQKAPIDNDKIQTVVPGKARLVNGEWVMEKSPELWAYKNEEKKVSSTESSTKPISQPNGDVYTMPDSNGRFNKNNILKGADRAKGTYSIDSQGNVGLIESNKAQRLINRLESYLAPVFIIEGIADAQTKTGIKVKKLAKVDSEGNIIEKGIIELTNSNFLVEYATSSDNQNNPRGRNNRRMRAFSINSETTINKEEVIEEVAQLIGTAAHSNIFFSHGYFMANGVQNYAYVEDGFLHFGNDGRVSLETVKHESMHFIIDYILSPKAARNLIQKAKEEKSRKTGQSVDSISDSEAHEYLADTFQITRPATTLIGKFIQFVKSVIFKIAPRAASINHLFAAANQGVFSNTVKYNSEANIDGAKYRAVENQYNTFEAVRKVSKAFGSLTEMERVRDTLMMSSILSMSTYGKTIDAVMTSPIPSTAVTMSQAILNFHKMLVSLDGPKYREVINDYRIQDRKFKMLSLSANGEVITGETKTVSDITPDEYLAMVDIYQNYDRDSDEYFEAYQAVMYYALNKMKDPFIYRVMIQSRYPAANIAELSEEYELSEINTGALHSDNEDRFPDNTRKQVLKAILGNLHVYNYAKTKAYRRLHPSQRFIEIEKLDRILFRAAEAAKSKGNKSFESLISEMENMLENATSGEYADLIYTFLVHFGDVVNNSKLAPKVDGGKFSLFEHSVLPLFQIEEAGYMYLANKGNWNQIAEAGYDETEKKAILATLEQKREGYLAVMAAMRTFYFSYTNKHLISHDKGKGEFNYKTYTSQNFAYIHSDIREGINKTHFSQDLSLNLYTKNAFIGDNKYISIGGSGFRMFVNGQDMKIVNKNGKIYTFADGVTAKELEDVFRFIFGRKISRPVINNILRNNVVNNIQFNVAEQLYHMMNSLYLSSTEMTTLETLPAGMNLDLSKDNLYTSQKKLQESFYAQSNYSATLGDMGDTEETAHSYYSPSDQWDFIQDSVSYNQAYESMNEGIKTVRNVDGTTRSTYVQSDTLADMFPMMTFNEDTSIRFANQVKNDIELMSQDNPLKDGAGFTNAILNGDINFSSIKEFIGISDKYKSSKGKEMTTNDIMYELFVMTKRNLISRGMFRAPVMLEILGDRSQLLFTEWHTGTGKGAQFMTANVKTVGKQKTISSVTINKKHLTGIVSQLIAYAENQRLLTAKKWNAIAGNEKAEIKINSKEGKLIENSLEKNLEYIKVGGNYVIGNGYTQKTNPYNNMSSSKWNSISELKKELDIEVTGTKIEDYQMAWIEKTFRDDISELMLFAKSSGIISNTEDEMNKVFGVNTKKRADIATRIEDLFNGLNSYLNDDTTTLTSEAKQVLTEALLSLKATYTNIRNGEELTYGKNIEIVNDLMAKVDMLKAYDKALSKSVNDQEQWSKWRALKSQVFRVDEVLEASKTASRTANEEILKGIFYSHHIFNSSFNQLARGSEEFYKNVPDFFKRGAGLTSPGSGFATSIIGPTSNYIEVADPKMSNKLFGKEIAEATDGVSLLNPLTHAKRRLAAGAELGNVSLGAQKNGYFKFDAGKNTWTYLKFSEMPINGSKFKDPFYMSVLKMMLSKKPYNGVQSIWNKFSFEIETVAKNNGKGFDELVKQMNDYAEQNGIPVIDGMVFSSCVKFGSRKTQQLSGNLESGLMADAKMNADENIIKIDNDYLRLQTVVAANTFDTKRTISTQLLYIIGVGSHNKGITDKINSAFAEAINDRIDLFEMMSKDQEKARFWIRRNAYKYFGNDGNSQKLMRIIFDNSIDTDTWSKKVFDTVIKQINESLRPSMPGINTVQMPAIEKVIEDKEGNARVLAYGENEEGSRMLRPISYGKKNDKGKVTYFTDRESLDKALEEDKSSVVFVPGEVIMPFVYKNKFGISKWTTMNDLMTVMGKNMKTKQTANHKPYKILRETFADMFKNVKTEEDIAKALYKDVYNHLLETNKTESLIEDKEKFLNSLAYYYYWLNRSMDIYHVRIPTSNAALGGYSRIIEFSWDYENTIFISPEKNILDDSDYDIDELHTYTRPIALDEKEKQSAVYKMQTSIFDGIITYYSNINNSDYILQKIDPGSLIKYADESSDSGYTNSTLNNTLKRKKSSNDGKETVGHFVTLQNVISRLFLLGVNKQSRLNQRDLIISAMPLFNQEDEKETTLRALDLLSNLITGSTDNLKLEGLLGKLNISKETSPLVAGMIVSGVSEVNIFKKLKDSFVNTLANKLYQKNSISSAGKVTLAGLIQDKISLSKRELSLLMKDEVENKDLIVSKENDIAEYEELLSYANKGEALRRISELTNIQGGYKAKPYFLYQKLASIEQIFGTSIDNVIAGIRPSIQEQIAFNETKYAPYSVLDKANEMAIRSYINYNELLNAFPQLLSFIALTKSAVSAVRNSSVVYDQLFNAAEIMGKETSTGTIRNENDFDLILGEIEKMNLADFLSSRGKIKMTFGERYYREVEGKTRRESAFMEEEIREYDFALPGDRERFFSDFNHYALFMQDRYPKNFFLGRLESRTRYDSRTGRNDLSFVEFANSGSINAEKASEYAESFNALDEHDKTLFRLYQAITFGFNARNGSFTDVIDTRLEKDYSEWKKENKAKRLFGYEDTQFKDEIYARIPSILSSSRKRQYRSKIIGNNTYAIKEREKKIITNPYTPYINTYNGKTTVFNVPFGYKVDDRIDKELSEKNRVTIKTNFAHKVKGNYRFPFMSKGYEVTEAKFRQENPEIILPGDVVVLSTGELAEMNYISPREFEIVTRRKTKTRKSLIFRTQSKAYTEDILNFIIQKLKKSFPNIQVELVDNATATTSGIGYVRGGVVYLNTDKLQLDTPIHEFTHMFVDILRMTNPIAYNKLYKLGESLLRSNDSSVRSIISAYKNLSREDLIEEIIANITGWNSEQKVIDAYFSAGDENYNSKGKSLWGKIKHAVKLLTDLARNTFFTMFDVSEGLRFEFNTIQEFADKFTDLVIAGGVISTLSSTELAMLEKASSVRESKVYRNTTVGQLIGMFSEAGNEKRTIEHSTLLEMLNLKEQIRSMGYKLPQSFIGREIEFTEDDLQSNSSLFTKAFEEYRNQEKNLPNNIRLFLNDVPTKENARKAFGVKPDGDSRISYNTLKSVQRALNYIPGRKYYTVAEFAREAGIEIDDAFVSEDFIVSVENKAISKDGSTEILISVYDVTNQNLNGTETHERSRNILEGFMSAFKARQNEVEVKNTRLNLKRLSMAMFINYIQASNPNIKVNYAGVSRVVDGDVQFSMVDMATMNQLLRTIGKIDAVMETIPDNGEAISLRKILTGESIVSNTVDWNNILASFYTHHKGLGTDYFQSKAETLGDMSRNDQIDFLLKRLQRLIGIKNASSDGLSRENDEEVKLILSALNSLKNPSILNNQVNRYEEIDNFEKYFFDTNSIGEEHFIMLKSAYHDSEFDVIEKISKLKKELEPIWEYFTDTVRGYVGNPGRQRYQKLFDTIMVKDSNGNEVEMRTGAIYWTDKILPGMTQEEIELTERAQKRGLSQRELDMGKKLVDTVTKLYEDLIYHNAIKRNTVDGYIDDKGSLYSADKAKEDLAKSRYYRGFMPMMKALNDEVASNSSFGNAVKKFAKEQADVHVLYQDGSSLKDMDNEEKYISSLTDRFFSQIGLRVNNGKYGSTNRMHGLLGLASDVDENGNMIMRAIDPSANENTSYDLQTMINYFALSTIRNIEYENKVLPIANALKIKLENDRKAQGGKIQDNIIDMIDDFVRMAIQGQIKHQEFNALVNVEKTMNVVGSVVKPAVMMFNPNVAVLSHFSNMFFIGTEAFANSISGDSGIKLKSLAKARALFATDWHKVTQLAVQYHLIDSTEYHQLHHRHRQIGERNVASSFMANYTNWMTDYYARAVVMTAKLIEDGVWDALEYDSASGEVKYNYKKDGQFFDESGKFKSKSTEVLFNNLKTQLSYEGYDIEEAPVRPYDKRSLRNLKHIADRSVGAFDASTKALMGSHGLFKNASVFNGWMATKLSMAFGGKNKFSNEGGEWITIEENGQLVPKWQREFIEGSYRTLLSVISKTIGTGKLQLSTLSPKERRNLGRLGAQLGLFAFIMALFNIDWEETSEMLFGDKKYGTTAEKLKKIKLINSIKYAAESLTIVGPAYSWAKEPFAMLNILSSSFTNAYGESSFKLITNIVPLSRLYRTVDNIVEETTDEKIVKHIENLNK